MNPVKCPNNHYYDADRYDSCPHCSSQAPQATNKAPAEEKKAEKKLFSRKKKPHSKKNDPSEMVTVALQPEDVQAIPQGGSQKYEPYEGVTVALEAENVEPPRPLQGAIGQEPVAQEPPAQQPPEPISPLQQAIRATQASNVSQDTKTIGFFSAYDEIEPVVGWIVCVKGAHMGEDFRLKAGRNTLGRAANMDVALTKEGSISRDRHAMIIYDPLQKSFLLQSGGGNGLTYLNEKLVLSYEELHAFDRIMLGRAEFRFIPFCGPEFSWDNDADETAESEKEAEVVK